MQTVILPVDLNSVSDSIISVYNTTKRSSTSAISIARASKA